MVGLRLLGWVLLEQGEAYAGGALLLRMEVEFELVH
jgi:hypothetical protein